MKIINSYFFKLFLFFAVFFSSYAVKAEDILALYKYLHANPELSWQEDKTADLLANKLEKLGFDVSRGIGKKGVVAIYENGEGPTLMIRADMDGLPVEEKTNLPYASKVRSINRSGIEVPVMHACGHDIHMAVLIGSANELIERSKEWSGTLIMILQPAEEVGQGSLAMLRDGLFEKFPRPDFNLALHVGSAGPAGSIGYHLGYSMANVDSVDIIVEGIGGHGAYPHTTVDPIDLWISLIRSLSTLVIFSFEISLSMNLLIHDRSFVFLNIQTLKQSLIPVIVFCLKPFETVKCVWQYFFTKLPRTSSASFFFLSTDGSIPFASLTFNALTSCLAFSRVISPALPIFQSLTFLSLRL